jgi:glycosyltransferase EpsD
VVRQKKREEIGIPQEAHLLISVGELSERKNHKVVVDSLQSLSDNYWYLIVGKGELKEELQHLDKTGRLKIVGYRNDIKELLWASDLFVFPSLQEGLPVALMEAMAAGLPIVCSRIRGNVDLIQDGKGGYLFDPHDIEGCTQKIWRIVKDDCSEMSRTNLDIIQKFDVNYVNSLMEQIYKNIGS